jgi:hypothetical protein
MGFTDQGWWFRMRLLRPVLVVMGITVAGTAGAAGVARATPPEDTAAVSTDPTGAHVRLRHGDTWVELRRARDGAPTTGCRRQWVLSPGAFALRITTTGDYHQVPMDPAPGPEYRTYHVWCDGRYVTSVWLRPQQFGVDPRQVAEELVRDLPYPAASVAASPAGRGLTGLESWFWVQGYSAASITDTVDRFGMTVTVEATPATTDWDFGDGTTANGLGLGTPPPGRSTVAHVFEVRGRPDRRVRALIRLAVRWRLGTGPWEELGPVLRTAVLDYPVVSSRAALVPDR